MTTAVMAKPTTISKATNRNVTNWVDPEAAGWKIIGVYSKMYMLRKISVEI